MKPDFEAINETIKKEADEQFKLDEELKNQLSADFTDEDNKKVLEYQKKAEEETIQKYDRPGNVFLWPSASCCWQLLSYFTLDNSTGITISWIQEASKIWQAGCISP